MRKPQPLLIQFIDLLQMEMLNWRWSWRGTLVTGLIAPMLSILALGSFARNGGPQALHYILTGNLVLSLLFQTMNKMCSRFTFMRATHTLDYFATLPIQRWLFVIAITFSFFLMALPGLLITLLAGVLYLKLPLHFHPLLLLILPLSALPLSGLGALIGVSVTPEDQAMAITNLLTLVLLAVGPVILPVEQLPSWLATTGWLSPASYVASALRQTLIGPITGRLWLDIGMMLAMTAASYWWVGRKMSWRER
ncbi:MAG: ABC transporter permease [Caldilineaceae bacterium]